jgi:translation initiation factor 1
MAKKKMQKLDLSNFFVQSEEEEAFKLFDGEEEKQEKKPKTKGGIIVRKEKKGRGGKVVTLVEGLHKTLNEMNDLCKKLKQHCGSGGSVKDFAIIIQGDNVQKITKYLNANGYPAKAGN